MRFTFFFDLSFCPKSFFWSGDATQFVSASCPRGRTSKRDSIVCRLLYNLCPAHVRGRVSKRDTKYGRARIACSAVAQCPAVEIAAG